MLEGSCRTAAHPSITMRHVAGLQRIECPLERLLAEIGQAADELQVEDTANRCAYARHGLRMGIEAIELVLNQAGERQWDAPAIGRTGLTRCATVTQDCR